MQEFLLFLEHASFQASMDQLALMISWVREKIQNTALFEEIEQRKIELAMEEALVNIVRHAYPHRSKKHNVEIILRKRSEHRIEFTIIDKGQPFNPLSQKRKCDLHSELEERKEGGLGIFFMQHYMDEMRYERQHPFNVLTLIKRLATY